MVLLYYIIIKTGTCIVEIMSTTPRKMYFFALLINLINIYNALALDEKNDDP